MPVIETQTITRRKIVRDYQALGDGARLFVKEVFKKTVEIEFDDALSPHELRQAAALFTEMADILEKGE